MNDKEKRIMTTPLSNSPNSISDEVTEDFEVIEDSSESLCSVSAESYLSLPEDILALSSISDLKKAVENCKAMIVSIPENSDERKWLVRRLIELRLRLENVKEISEENPTESKVSESHKVVLGHHFSLQNFPTSTLHYYCDKCSGIIWNILHSWYLCSDCEYKCHEKCLSNICRVCAHVIVSENPVFIVDICPEPENGLADQNYRCAECLAHTSFSLERIGSLGPVQTLGEYLGYNTMEARLCDYTGKYYCSTCHWNSTSVIPARVILNWDFKERMVCRSSKQTLKLMAKLPILKLEELNPVLFGCVEELGTVKLLRQQLMHMKKYLTSCKSAVEGQLMWQSGDKHHFFENADSYSLQDLLELRSGELIKFLNKTKQDFIRHIKVDCEVCKGRGFFCELCTDNVVIFPFEENVTSCARCQSTFHFYCWVKNNNQCRKCFRIRQRSLKIESDNESSITDS